MLSPFKFSSKIFNFNKYRSHFPFQPPPHDHDFEDKITSEQYAHYLRPLPGKLMKAFNLDVHYKDGHGNWLIRQTEDKDKKKDQEIFDATGGYGANLLGHKNKELMQSLVSSLSTGSPFHTQGSLRASSIFLGEKLSQMLERETQVGPWITHLSNSGTEAVEAALKHALIYFFQKMQNLRHLIQEGHHKSEKLLIKASPAQRKLVLAHLQAAIPVQLAGLSQKVTHEFLQKKTLEGLLTAIHQYNKTLLKEAPRLVSIEKGFHGKTLGSLKVTANRSYRTSFFVDADRPVRNTVLPRNNLPLAKKLLDAKRRNLVTLSFLETMGEKGLPNFKIHSISSIAGVILEPIQGEAGIFELPTALISMIREQGLLDDFLLIFDEIQSGLFRTGHLTSGFHGRAVADIYCFSKGLGGGLVKIGATAILARKYIDDFGMLHTSTFAEDDLSSTVGLKVLDILDGVDSPVKAGMAAGEFLKEKLLSLKKKYPLLIKDVRGKGLMLAVEFSENIRTLCFEFKIFCDAGMIGYLFSSALLHHGQLRIAPTLSCPYSLRIEPSLFLTEGDCKFILDALSKLLKSIHQLDMKYFFSHLYPHDKIIDRPGIIKEGTVHYAKGGVGKNRNKRVAVFLSHPIDTTEISKTLTSHKKISKETLLEKLHAARDISIFDITYRGTIYDNSGEEIELVLLSLPLPSEEILSIFKSEQRPALVEKIQQALYYAKSLGAHTVGLGQFTSIVTNNGHYLDPLGMTLTTGNAYTCALAVEAALREARNKHIDKKDARIACVGAAGNIISVSASILTNHCTHLSLVYHTSLEGSEKLRKSLSHLFSDILKAEAKAPCAQAIKEELQRGFPQNAQELLDFMAREAVKSHLSVETNLDQLPSAHIIICGANTTDPFITAKNIGKKAIVVDLAVPRNVGDDVVKKRRDITYILGGIAHLPKPRKGRPSQGVLADFFPLHPGSVFGCMAETIALTFAEKNNKSTGKKFKLEGPHIGPISRAQVEAIKEMATEVGFTLGGNKTSASY